MCNAENRSADLDLESHRYIRPTGIGIAGNHLKHQDDHCDDAQRCQRQGQRLEKLSSFGEASGAGDGAEFLVERAAPGSAGDRE